MLIFGFGGGRGFICAIRLDWAELGLNFMRSAQMCLGSHHQARGGAGAGVGIGLLWGGGVVEVPLIEN